MADKQVALVNAIAEGVSAKQDPKLDKLIEQLAQLLVATNSILARVALIENATATGGASAKRNVRAPAGKGAAGKKPAGKAGQADDTSKVTNSLLFFRYAMANDLDDCRATWGTDDNVAEAEQDATVGKRDKDKDAAGYWSAVGAALWKTILTDEDKKTVRSQFDAWKEQGTRDASEDQLEEEEATA